MFFGGTPLSACWGFCWPSWEEEVMQRLHLLGWGLEAAAQDWLGWSWDSRCGVSICIMLCSIVSVWSIYQLFRAKESPSAATANTQLNSLLQYTALIYITLHFIIPPFATLHHTALHWQHCTELKGKGSNIKPVSLPCSVTQSATFSVLCALYAGVFCIVLKCAVWSLQWDEKRHPIHLRNNKHVPHCPLSTQILH